MNKKMIDFYLDRWIQYDKLLREKKIDRRTHNIMKHFFTQKLKEEVEKKHDKNKN